MRAQKRGMEARMRPMGECAAGSVSLGPHPWYTQSAPRNEWLRGANRCVTSARADGSEAASGLGLRQVSRRRRANPNKPVSPTAISAYVPGSGTTDTAFSRIAGRT